MRSVAIGVFVLLLAQSGVVARETEARFLEARGFGYLGGFFVTTINTSISVFSDDNPLGARIDLNRDLGFADSDIVPRATLGWRFRERHLLSGGWYRIKRDARKELDVEIPLPPGEEFPVDALVDSVFETEVYKVQYTYLFHKDSRVTLGVSGGLFVATLGLTIDGEEAPPSDRFSESFTAPLPVFGGRLTYQATPKSRVITTADWFFIKYGDYAGVLSDIQLYYTHRTFKHVGFAGGLNVLTQKIEVEDDGLLWEVDQGLVGFLAALTFYF